MDNTQRAVSSDRRKDQVQQSTSLERQDQPETSSERERRNVRFLIPVPSDAPSTSDTDHPMPVPELGQTSDQDHPQPERQQERRRNIPRRILTRMYHAIRCCLLVEYPYPYDMNGNPRIRWEDDFQDRSRIEGHIGINLYGVSKEEWDSFVRYVVTKYDPVMNESESESEGENKNQIDMRLLWDILKFGGTEHVNDAERGGDEYKNLQGFVRKDWEGRKKQKIRG